MTLALAIAICLLLGVLFWAMWQRVTLQRLERQLLALPGYGCDLAVSLPLGARLQRAIDRNLHHQRQLTDELEINRDLLKAAPIGYLQVDADNRLIFCNAQAQVWLGIDRWHPQQARSLLEVTRSLELDRLVARARHAQTPQHLEWSFHHAVIPKPGSPQTSSQAARSVALRGCGCPLPEGGVGIFLENQQALVDLIQMQERTFSELAHELRTPLTSIRLVSETLQGRLSGTERQWVDLMLAEANRLIDLIEDWLDLAQLQKSPSQLLRLETIDLQTLTTTVWQTLEPLAACKQLTFQYQTRDDRPVELIGDRQRLMQVFLNLFDNAIAHSPVNGEIQVLARTEPTESEQPTRTIIDVIDSGPGFSETDRERIFERLYRSSTVQQQETDTNARPGTGLGLSIVQQIVRAHRGTIQAKNHPETNGAWLQIELPSSLESPSSATSL